MLTAELLLRWKGAFQVVLPVLLALDMVHSIYYVAGLYQDRLEDWKKEDFAETSSEVLPVMQRVLYYCQDKDQLLWPKAVTTAFETTCGSRPSPSQQPNSNACNSAVGNAPAQKTPDPSIFHDVFIQLGVIAPMEAMPTITTPSVPEPACSGGPQDNHEDDERVPPIGLYLNRLWSLLPQWSQTKLASVNNSAWHHLGILHTKPYMVTEVNAESPGPAMSAASIVREPVVGPSMVDSLAGDCRRHLTRLGRTFQMQLHQLPEQVKLLGCPWPCMNVTRRSALRWQIDWHGMDWPVRQEAKLELQLDQYC